MADLFPTNRPFDEMEKLFSSMFPSLYESSRQMSVDVKEKEDRFEVDADIPGFNKEDIHVEYDDERHILSIQARQEQSTEEKDDDRHYLRRERSMRTYSRQLPLPNVDSSKVTATYENGVLHLTLPKRDQLPENRRRISIE